MNGKYQSVCRLNHRCLSTHGNTGVQTAQFSIDTLQFTLPDGVPLKVVQTCLGGGRTWKPLRRGAFGYRVGLELGRIKLYYDGPGGIHVQLVGTACRQLVADGIVADWAKFLGRLLNWGAKFSRLDIRADDHEGVLSLALIERHLRDNLYSSRTQWWECTESHGRGKGLVGRTLYIGAKSSDKRMRIYDKAAEQGLTDQWIRIELQLRRTSAQELAQTIARDGIQVGAAAFRTHIEFKFQGAHSQRERWPIADWWQEFLGSCQKLRATVRMRPCCSLSRSKDWLRRQVAPTLAFLLIHPAGGLNSIHELLADGASRLSDAHLSILRAAGIQVTDPGYNSQHANSQDPYCDGEGAAWEDPALKRRTDTIDANGQD